MALNALNRYEAKPRIGPKGQERQSTANPPKSDSLPLQPLNLKDTASPMS
jgi:hypothetical protein